MSAAFLDSNAKHRKAATVSNTSHGQLLHGPMAMPDLASTGEHRPLLVRLPAGDQRGDRGRIHAGDENDQNSRRLPVDRKVQLHPGAAPTDTAAERPDKDGARAAASLDPGAGQWLK